MNARRQTNTFTGGMNMDIDNSLLKTNQYKYSENIRIVANDGDSFGIMQNIEGFLKTNPSSSLNGETIIHVDTVRDLAIVFTKTNSSDGFNIYRYDFSKSETEPAVTKIVNNKPLNIKANDKGYYSISSVCRWESKDNIKIYWSDGFNQIRVLNVDATHDKDNENVTADSINIIPNSVLPSLSIKGLGSGSLKAGKYQYAYQLFNPRSSETSISAVSKLFTASKGSKSNNSQEVIGSEKEANTGLSIRLEAVLPTTTLTRAKIIRLYYKDNTSMPDITVIDDVVVTNNILAYEDKGGSFVTELTVDEFNALVSYQFIPKVIEAKDNMLFAGNIEEDTWDITDADYDTRAYRCNSAGNILLLSNSSQGNESFSVNEVGSYSVDPSHDCICPYNDGSDKDYKYRRLSSGTLVLGGEGPNISYRFIKANLIEDSSTITSPENGFNEDFSLVSKAYNTNRIPLYSRQSGSDVEVGAFKLPTTNNILNYANPIIDAYLRGYQREEIYRFGIVFYNEKNLPSSVHWIADIKMPEAGSIDGYPIFTPGMKVELGDGSTTGNISVVTHPLGIEFTVSNLEKLKSLGITGYEIVRCERTIADRSILMQGLVSTITQNKSESSTLTPLPYLTYSSSHGLVSQSKDYAYCFAFSEATSPEYFIFISPELCVNRENATEVLNMATGMKGVMKLRSVINPDPELGDGSRIDDRVGFTDTKAKVLANAKTVKNPDNSYVKAADNKYSTQSGWAHGGAIAAPSHVNLEETKAINAISINNGNFYDATLAKYYYPVYEGSYNEAVVDEIVMAVDTDPFDQPDDKWRSKPTSIGGKQYYNWTYKFEDRNNTDYDDDNIGKFGPHGVCAVFKSSDMTMVNGLVGAPPFTAPGPKDANTIILCNLKQSVSPYGGSSYVARQNSTYISTGSYNSVDYPVTFCFGGDTYVGVFDYANAMLGFNPEDLDPSNSRTKAYNGAYFPCESSINVSLRNDDFSTSKTYQSGNGYSNHFVQNDIVQISNLYTQTKPLYSYNDAYSAQGSARIFVSKSMYNIDNLLTDSRVLNSEQKTNNEVTDSWTKFKVANYIDVDNRFGAISELKLFKNNLLFWQDDAFGTLAVNERSLITDNNIGALTLGTGGVLTRSDYFTTKNGLKQEQLRNVTQSDTTVYWYDADRNEICGFNGSLQTVSKLKGVQSYLNDNKSKFTNNPQSTYDKKYNEVLLTLEDKTLVFNEQLGVFTSFYTIEPDWYVEFSDKLYTFKNLNLFKYNSGNDTNLYTDKDKVSYMVFAINQDYPQTKTFDNVEYGGNFTYKTNFGLIWFNTKRQTSFSLTNEDIDYREDTYKFAIPRNSIELTDAEQLANKSYRDRMKGKYLECHYKYDCNGGNTFEVPYISTAYRYSMI